jgi:transcriptional regulator with XRE-family HTH domain
VNGTTVLFSELLVRARQGRNLSQSDVAHHLGIDATTVSRWESHDALPSGRRFDEVVRLLEIDPDEAIAAREAQKRLRRGGRDRVAFDQGVDDLAAARHAELLQVLGRIEVQLLGFSARLTEVERSLRQEARTAEAERDAS